jgi:preprotein translocase subunit SecG
MSEIETSDQNTNNQSEELINNQNNEETKSKDNTKLKYLLFALFTIFIIICLLVCTFIYYQYSQSETNDNPSNKRTKEKNEKGQKLEDSKIIKYETPFILTNTLDYLLYPYHSDIIKNMDDYEFIRDSLGKISLKMVFNSNINGDYALDVHTRVNYHHILAIIETENGNRFGGYTSDNFSPQTLGLSSTNIELLKQDHSAFLFNLDQKKIYNIKKKDITRALDCDEYFTFCFGEGDLLLRNQFMTNGGSSNFPDCYGDENTKKFELTNGEENFTVKSFEIYHVLFFAEFGDEGNRMGVHKNYVK